MAVRRVNTAWRMKKVLENEKICQSRCFVSILQINVRFQQGKILRLIVFLCRQLEKIFDYINIQFAV